MEFQSGVDTKDLRPVMSIYGKYFQRPVVHLIRKISISGFMHFTELSYVGAGKIDGFADPGDLRNRCSGGLLILEEAGGIVSDRDGTDQPS